MLRLTEYRQIDERFDAEMEAQITLSRWLARLSPFSCFAMAAAELADEGVAEKRRYLEQLKDFHPDLLNYAFDEAEVRQDYRLANNGNRLGPWSSSRQKPIPTFIYEPAAGMDYPRAVAVDVSILAALVVVFFMLSYMRFLRYDVR